MKLNTPRLSVEALEHRDVPATLIPIGGAPTAPTPLLAVGADSGGPPHVRVFTGDGRELYSFYAFDQGFVGGVRLATADFTGDGFEDIAVGAGPGAPGGHVKVWDGRTGEELQSFFAFDQGFLGGVFLGVGDVTADGTLDLLVAAGPGGPAHAKVYDGPTGAETLSFIGGDPALRGGAYIAGGDFNGDGADDIVLGTGRFNPEFIDVYDARTLQVIRSFRGYDAEEVDDIDFGELGGPALADAIRAGAPLYREVVEGIYFGGRLVDLDGDGRLDLATGRVLGDQDVIIFGGRNDGGRGDDSFSDPFDGGNGRNGDDDDDDDSEDARGVRPLGKDLNGDGVGELIIGAGPGSAEVVIIDARTGQVIRRFNPFAGFTGGVTVG